VPEGDTVWRQARQLDAALTGRQLTICDVRVPAFATVDFTGSTVDAVESRGKHLVIRTAGHLIHSHLKMEGTWHIYPAGPGVRWRRPAHTARCILGTEASTAVGFSLGLLEIVPADQEDSILGYLGPDLLGPDWDAELALQRLLARPERAVGVALLDQRNLAGIGNVFRSELCFLVGIHPELPIGQVPDLPRLVALSKRLLEANKARTNRSTTGGPARGDAAMWVYGRAGRPCRRCGTTVRHDTSADPDAPTQQPRDIYYCPHCQPVPRLE
jgi:endonuclease-8